MKQITPVIQPPISACRATVIAVCEATAVAHVASMATTPSDEEEKHA